MGQKRGSTRSLCRSSAYVPRATPVGNSEPILGWRDNAVTLTTGRMNAKACTIRRHTAVGSDFGSSESILMKV
jgi:hypothetical protein